MLQLHLSACLFAVLLGADVDASPAAPTEQATPEQATPEQATPAQATPAQATPEQATPEQATPEQATPEQATPEQAAPDQAAPEQATPTKAAPSQTAAADQPAAEKSQQQSSSPKTVAPDDEEILQIEVNVVSFTNQERARYGLAPLEVDKGLMKTARQHCAWMTRNHSLVHTRIGVAENIAMGQRNSREVVRDWMNSSGHRANILNSGHRRIGVSAYRTAGGTIFWCQQFLR